MSTRATKGIRACSNRSWELGPKRKPRPRLQPRSERRSGGALLLLIAAGLAVTAAPPSPASAGQAAPAGQPAGDASVAVEPLTSPAGANSAQPQLTVEGARAILSWIETADARASVKFAERTAAGRSPPRVVVSGDDLLVNSADVPSVRALPDGTLVAHWLQENGPNPEAYNLLLSSSKDGGRSWSRPASPHRDGTPTQHGFASLFPAAGGGLGLVWLDGRATKPDAPDSRESGDMALRAALFDPGGAQRGEMLVDARVCDCCPTSAAVTSEGVIVAYRDRSADEVRDVSVSRLTAGRWSVPTPIHQDRWRLVGCPVNGPSVAARGREVAVAWFTVQNGQGRVLLAFSRDAGRTFAAPIRVDDADAIGRVQVAVLERGSAAVSWVEMASGRSQLKARRIAPGGSRSAAVTLAEGIGGQHPRLARRGDELLFAWVENTRGSTRVRTARASLAAKEGS